MRTLSPRSPSVVCAIIAALLYTAAGMAQPPRPTLKPPPPTAPAPAPSPAPPLPAATSNPASSAAPRSSYGKALSSGSSPVPSSRSSTADGPSAEPTIGTPSVPRLTAATTDAITASMAPPTQITPVPSLVLAATSKIWARPTQVVSVFVLSPTSPTSALPGTVGTTSSAQGHDITSTVFPQMRVVTSFTLDLYASTTYSPSRPPDDGGGVTWILAGSMAGLLALIVIIATVAIAMSLICHRKVKTVSLLKKVVVNNPNYYIPETVPASSETCCDEYDSVDELGFTTKAEPSSYPVNDYDSTSPLEQLEHSAKRAEYYEITASRMDTYENCSAFGTWKGTPSKECTPDISVVETRRIDPTVASRDSTEGHFFEESDVYWRPACRFEELYQQLSKMKYREIPTSNIRILAQIGAGEFGMVKRAVWSSPAGPREVAVKMLPPDATEKDQIRFLQEAAVNGQFNFHPNIVHLFGVVTVEKPLMMVLELLESGDLRNYLQTQKAQLGKTSSAERWPYTLLGFCRHVASGMEYLSNKGFVHRDLAARNILVSEERICKIADFGMSRDLDDDTYYISQGGKIPVKWTAPEAIHFKKYSSLSDVWSYGAVLYEIWSFGQKPFEKHTNLEVIRMIDQGIRLGPPPGCPRALYLLMIQCWHPEKTNRPTFEGIVQTLKISSSDLLQWSSDDLNVHPQVNMLGADMSVAELLYADLQYVYRN